MLEVAASRFEELGLFLGSVAASGKVLLRVLAPSRGEEKYDGKYDARKYIKHGDNKGVILLGRLEFDLKIEECTVELSRAAAFSLLNHSEKLNCVLEVC